MTLMLDAQKVVDDLLVIRHNIFILMSDAKVHKANGKFFAYKKSYNFLSSMIYPLNDQLPAEDKREL